MEQCPSCGASMSAAAAWCSQCYRPVGTGSQPRSTGVSVLAVPDRAALVTRAVPPPPSLPPTMVRSRWRKTQTTFGPVGRIIATVCLIVPFLVMVVGGVAGLFFPLVGAGIWLVVILPWGLRDVWKAGLVVPSQ